MAVRMSATSCNGTCEPLAPVTRTSPSCCDVVAKVASVANAHGEALTAFDGGGEVLAADRGLDHVFDVSDVDAVAGSGGAVDVSFRDTVRQ